MVLAFNNVADVTDVPSAAPPAPEPVDDFDRATAARRRDGAAALYDASVLDGWDIGGRANGRFIHGGYVEEDGEIWDERDVLVAQSRQLSLTPRE